jgi:multicomponent Na+:H+ antiporter subunit D
MVPAARQLEEGRWIFIGVIVLSSLLNAVYFFRIIEKMYLGGATNRPGRRPRPRRAAWYRCSPVPVVALAARAARARAGNVFIVTRSDPADAAGGF